MADARVTVIYLAGWGRSGSTIIGSLLGQMPGSAYIGELWNLWEDAYVRDDYCGCGSHYSQCAFWPPVLRACDIDGARGKRLCALKMENLGSRSMLFGKKALRRSLETGAMAGYARSTEEVLHEASRRLNANVLIDASKTPNLLELYGRLDTVDVKVLHIVRDPRAVAYSWYHRPKVRGPKDGSGTMERHNPLRSTASWMARNSMIARGAKELDLPYLLLRYEDFVADPDKALARICAAFDLPPIQLERLARQGGNQHSIRGNPVRFESGPISIRSDQKWERELPAGEKALVTAVALPLLKRYGYPLLS